jgi:hypothetical protein
MSTFKIEECEMPKLNLLVEEIAQLADRPPFLSPDGWDTLTHPSLASTGYRSREYRVSGEARVFRTPDAIPSSERYATRVLVIAPERDADFSGVVHIELLNPSSGSDFPMFWPDAGFHLMARGDAYLGVTCKSVTIADLRSRDPERYGSLLIPHDSMIWDLLGSVAGATHQEEAGGMLLGLRAPSRRFATGWSQSGSFLRSYLSERFHEEHSSALAGGVPNGDEAQSQIIDGYLIGVSSGGFGPMGYVEIDRDGEMELDTSFTPTESLPGLIALDDHRRTISRPPVPVIEYLSEDEAVQHLWHQRPDSDLPGDQYRCYQVPARGHETGLLPTSARRSENGLSDGEDLDSEDPPRHDGSQWLIAATITHLVLWSEGTPPPRADPIPFDVPKALTRDTLGVDYTGIVPVHDETGHAMGGLRYLEIELPLARMQVVPSQRHIMRPWEHVPFTRAEADARYGGEAAYAQLARRRAAQLVSQGWLLPEHTELAIRAACEKYPSHT